MGDTIGARTLGEIIHSNVAFADVLAELRRWHQNMTEEDDAGYRMVFDRLMVMQPTATNMTCVLNPAGEDGNEWVDVSGLEPNNDTNFAIEFAPWSEWLSMPVRDESENMRDAEIVAHCLHEMTWFGFEEQTIQSELNDITDAVDEIRDQIGKRDEAGSDA